MVEGHERVVPFELLETTDLTVGSIYLGGDRGSYADDPIARIVPVGNQGGIRFTGGLAPWAVKLVVLYTTFAEPDWPDSYDPSTGQFVYFGDNKKPDVGLHETRRQGNELLRDSFAAIHVVPARRDRVPPFLVFAKSGPGRAVRFLGLAVPGSDDLREDQDLVAIWKSAGTKRFQNYRAVFTILDVPRVERAWLKDILAGQPDSERAPAAWRFWRETGLRKPFEIR